MATEGLRDAFSMHLFGIDLDNRAVMRLYELTLYLATCAGNIPSHALLKLFYRRVFGITIPGDSIFYWKAQYFAILTPSQFARLQKSGFR